MQHWHEAAQAMSSWLNGKEAGGMVEKDRKELAKEITQT